MGNKKLMYIGIACVAAIIVIGMIYRGVKLYGISRQLLELELQENELEVQYKTGLMPWDEYIRQKGVIDAKEEHLDWQKDFWEFDFD